MEFVLSMKEWSDLIKGLRGYTPKGARVDNNRFLINYSEKEEPMLAAEIAPNGMLKPASTMAGSALTRFIEEFLWAYRGKHRSIEERSAALVQEFNQLIKIQPERYIDVK